MEYLTLAVTAVVIMILIMLYLWCMKPNKRTKLREEKIQPFMDTYIAHRGLFDDKLMIPENSLAAFKRAVEHGFGVELDVRLTKDHELVVFHDASLKRMCGADKLVSYLEYDELRNYPLKNTTHYIPKLDEVLKVIESVPAVIEIKAEKNGSLTSELLWEKLKNYKGKYCIESFYPLTLFWYRKNKPEIIRGQLVSDYIKNKKTDKRRKISSNIILNGLLLDVFSRPDFIAYNYKCAYDVKYRLMRKLYNFTSAGWTIKSEEELRKVQEVFEIIIFDSFIPQKRQQK